MKECVGSPTSNVVKVQLVILYSMYPLCRTVALPQSSRQHVPKLQSSQSQGKRARADDGGGQRGQRGVQGGVAESAGLAAARNMWLEQHDFRRRSCLCLAHLRELPAGAKKRERRRRASSEQAAAGITTTPNTPFTAIASPCAGLSGTRAYDLMQ